MNGAWNFVGSNTVVTKCSNIGFVSFLSVYVNQLCSPGSSNVIGKDTGIAQCSCKKNIC